MGQAMGDQFDKDEGPSRLERWAPAALLAVAAFTVTDMISDWREGAPWGHLALEISSIVLLVGIAWSMVAGRERRIRRLRHSLLRERRRADDHSEEMERTRAEAARWRAEAEQAVEGLSRAIDAQFDRWELTPAEREVALLLLKGLSHREVALVRSTRERTAREQARAVYRKSGLAGRSELAAFFLEDLLSPARVDEGDLATAAEASTLRG